MEEWHFLRDRQPDALPLDRKIGMHGEVPEIDDIHPWRVRVRFYEAFREMRGGFADDDQLLQDRAPAHIIVVELVKGDPLAKSSNGFACLAYVWQI